MSDHPPKNGTAQVADPKSERTVTWPVKEGETLVGSVRLSKGVYECLLPDGSVVETFKSLKFALEFLHQRERPISPEEQAARLVTDVDELSRKSLTDRSFWLADFAKRNSLDEARLQELVNAELEAREKRAREQKLEDERREQRTEKQRTTAKRNEERKERDEERKREREERDEERKREREEREARKEAERRERETQKALAAIVKLPSAQHEAELKKVARRLDGDVEILRAELDEMLGDEAEKIRRGIVEPWDEPVATRELLDAAAAQFAKYIIVHDTVVAPIIPLWIAFAWVHDIAAFSPILIIESARFQRG
jgi:hypothetical protein